jgi:hypothetical protein
MLFGVARLCQSGRTRDVSAFGVMTTFGSCAAGTSGWARSRTSLSDTRAGCARLKDGRAGPPERARLPKDPAGKDHELIFNLEWIVALV